MVYLSALQGNTSLTVQQDSQRNMRKHLPDYEGLVFVRHAHDARCSEICVAVQLVITETTRVLVKRHPGTLKRPLLQSGPITMFLETKCDICLAASARPEAAEGCSFLKFGTSVPAACMHCAHSSN